MISALNATDKFEIMMYLVKTGETRICFREYVKLQDWTDYVSEEVITIVFDEDIHMAYNKIHNLLSFDDKLNILSQRVYEDTYGLSVVDLLIMEDTLDSISGGVSGITSNNCSYIEDDIISGSHKPSCTYDSIWVVYKGKPIHLKFLSFIQIKKLDVYAKICRHGRTGHLTSSEGGIKHILDGSR